MTAGIYIHLPFCKKKCIYCDFVSFCGVSESTVNDYLSALGEELNMSWYRNFNYSSAGTSASRGVQKNNWNPELVRANLNELTIYIGGGTPSVLTPRQFETLFSIVRKFEGKITEFTVECNPESIDGQKLSKMFEAGVNRLSFGVQSFNDNFLAWLGRLHTAGDAEKKYNLARSCGFKNINIDLIYGISGQDLVSWEKTLKETIALSPEHVSIYPLTIEEGTPYFDLLSESIKSRPDPDLQADMYFCACEFLESRGYKRYEISNFARPGRECRHNLNYWLNGEYLGLGVSAVSYVNGVRSKNVSSLTEYFARLEKNRSTAAESEKLEGRMRSAERLILGLRTSRGVRLLPGEECFGEKLSNEKLYGLIEKSPDGVWRLTKSGFYLSNAVFRELLV
ncbi:MAG: radical SAM family heme chaperone HemW [Elusimicrobiota bacterium]